MTAIAFFFISLLSLLLLYIGTGSDKRLLLYFVAFQILTGMLAFLKVFKNTPQLFPGILLGTIALTYLSLKRIDPQKANTNILLGIHVLRIPVELILFQLYVQHKVPEVMTYQGWNFDILTGITALLILIYRFLTHRNIQRQIFIIWNIAGLVLLLIIVSLAILSSPLPVQQFAFEQPNVAVLEFPYSFLPSCVVPIVFISHILLIRKRE